MGSKRDAYVEKLKARLDDWNKRIDELEAGARQFEAGTRTEVQKRIDTAKARRDELAETIESLRKASDSAWKDLRRGAKGSYKALDKAIRAAAARFKKQPPQTPSAGTE